ncbi:TetR family transcriptional regulator [Arthrobacter koreensis]|jgi:DNA-binding transcriptional regulator YbjK|uniref:TetR/AcrR family transcriptional regulator n=2 Tax=Arthrobacter koreensis TaxID=199136 RepID=UPI001264CB50|nr:TetR family transcriptional regulator [Arthrobacter koreensis]
MTHSDGSITTGTATRRFDPDRRDRLIDTTLDVIARHGVAGTTHRKIAAAADVPVGSVTYHFASLDDLLAAAFTRLAERTAAQYAQDLGAAASPDEALDVISGYILGMLGSPGTLFPSYELYLMAARRPELRRITDRWMARSRAALGRHFDEQTTVMLDAMIEGLSMHSALSLEPLPRNLIREALQRVVTPQ